MSDGIKFPFERFAMNREEMPDGLDLPDQMAFTALRNIYHAYRERILSRDAATQEKRKIYTTWDKAKREQDFRKRLMEVQLRTIRETEIAASICRKDPTPENALRLCDALVGLPTDLRREDIENV